MARYLGLWEAVKALLSRDVTRLENFIQTAPQVLQVTTKSAGPYQHTSQHGLQRKPTGIMSLGGAAISWTADQAKLWNDQEVVFTYVSGLAGVDIQLLVW